MGRGVMHPLSPAVCNAWRCPQTGVCLERLILRGDRSIGRLASIRYRWQRIKKSGMDAMVSLCAGLMSAQFSNISLQRLNTRVECLHTQTNTHRHNTTAAAAAATCIPMMITGKNPCRGEGLGMPSMLKFGPLGHKNLA